MSVSDKKKLLARAEKFLKKAQKQHGSRYDYKDVIYVDAKTKVLIRCDVHGPFEQTPDGHLQGRGCKPCGAERRGKARRLGRQKFIEKSIEKHGNFYDYSKVIYEINSEKVIIICPDHGEFSQIAANHMNGEGCEDCGNERRKKALTKTTEEFVKEAKRIHKNYYDYSSVSYEGSRKDVNIICPEHGVFPQSPTGHLTGRGCRKCGIIKRAKKRRLTNKKFFEKAVSVHGDRYDYSHVN